MVNNSTAIAAAALKQTMKHERADTRLAAFEHPLPCTSAIRKTAKTEVKHPYGKSSKKEVAVTELREKCFFQATVSAHRLVLLRGDIKCKQFKNIYKKFILKYLIVTECLNLC